MQGNQPEISNEFLQGDKIRIRVGENKGFRGRIKSCNKEECEVDLLPDHKLIIVKSTQITNYSLAARKAWKTIPKKSGRPLQPGPRKKRVSVRIDEEVWEQLKQAAEQGLIPSREEWLNSLLKQKVQQLLGKKEGE
jgi:uncharacterized protein (DUF4415 family)